MFYGALFVLFSNLDIRSIIKKMKKFFFIFIFFILALVSLHHPRNVFAVENPLDNPNNKVGIHILFPEEIFDAAALVNASGGEWGYVLIPIQSGDKDLIKWQTFMDNAKKLHVIPIIRLATEGDYFNTKVWRKPNFSDIVDFANFLGSLNWPTKNRYVVVYNEVNRGDEWGGDANPAEYAEILSYATTFFKYISPDFFIISAGLDNAAPSQGSTYMNEYEFLKQMQQNMPDVFKQIDGIGSHSYPNPGFSQPPTSKSQMSIASFSFEKSLIDSLSDKNLPIFITETGWSKNAVGDGLAAQYYKQAFLSVWNDPSIVAVTPFLLKAGGGPFTQFSFLNTDGSNSQIYKSVAALPKLKGEPILTTNVLGSKTMKYYQPSNFLQINSAKKKPLSKKKASETFLRWLFGLQK